MRFRVTHTTKYAYSDPVAVCHNLARLAPRGTERQHIESFRLVVAPEPSDLVERSDALGNRVDYFSIPHVHKGLTLTAVSEVAVTEPAQLPEASLGWENVRESLRRHDNPRLADAYRFAFPSTHVPNESVLRDYAALSFTPGRPVLEAARELTTRVNSDFEYNPAATDVSTPVLEAFEKRAGVCQDFAHLQLAMIRSLGLAARYVSGYLRTIPPPGKERLVGADASHAWLSVYCGRAGWVDFDPTNDCVPSTDHVTLAWGRDYADVAPVQGVFVGGGSHTLNVSVDVAPLDDAPTPHSR